MLADKTSCGQKRTICDMKGFTVVKRSSLEQNSDTSITEQTEQQRVPEQHGVSEQQGVSSARGEESSAKAVLCPVLADEDNEVDEEEVIVFDTVSNVSVPPYIHCYVF